MNEGSGTSVADESTGGTSTLTLSSASMWTTGNAGGGIAGNGSSFYASAASVDAAANVVTVCFWFKDSAFGANEMIAELGPNISLTSPAWYFFAQDSSTLQTAQRNTGGALRTRDSTPPSTGAWHHYAVIYDNATPQITVYIDGVLVGTGAGGAADPADWATATVNLLARDGGGAGANFFCNGSLDDFRIYSGNRASDIPAIYADPK